MPRATAKYWDSIKAELRNLNQDEWLNQEEPTNIPIVYIDHHYRKKWPTNISMLFTTVLNICWVYISITTLKHVTQNYIPRIYWSLLFQEGSNKYICMDYYWLCCLQKLDQKVHILYILITLVISSMTIKYLYNDYYWLEDNQKVVLSYIYIYIYILIIVVSGVIKT